MTKLIVTTLAAAALTTGTLTAAAPANAAPDTPGCVSQQEFAKVKKGMSAAKVHGIFDSKGKRDAISSGGGFTFEIRSYKTCTPYGAVAIGYENGKLSNKTAVF